jgi:hypothetical protein
MRSQTDRMAEFKAEWPDEWKHERRIEYSKERVTENLVSLWAHNARFEKTSGNSWERAIEIYYIQKYGKQIRKDLKEIVYREAAMKGEAREGIREGERERARASNAVILAESYGIQVKRNTMLCPFHDDKHPSMSIKDNRFRCWSCGWKGDAIDFVMKKEGCTFHEAVRRLQ